MWDVFERPWVRELKNTTWAPLFVGLVARAVWVVACPNEPTSDQFIYHQAATDLARGLGYVEAPNVPAGYWPVGYSASLAPAYIALGAAPSSAFAMNIVFGLLLIAGGAKLGAAWFGVPAGRLAAWVLALHPTLLLYTTCIASENAFMPAVVWFAYAATRSAAEVDRKAWIWASIAGVLAGVAGYVRPTIVFLGILAPALLLLYRRRWLDVAGKTACIAACAGLTLAPWAFRNLDVFGEFYPFSFNGATNLWLGNHEGANGAYVPVPADVEALPLPERERVLGTRARAFIFEHPLEYARLCVQRTIDTMKSDTIAVVWNRTGIEATFGPKAEPTLKVVTTFLHWVLYGSLTARLLGAARSSYKTRRWQLTISETASLVSIAALAIPFVFILSGNRFHLSLLPFACLLASRWALQALEARAARALAT